MPFAYNCFVKCLGKVLALLILIVLDASDKFSTEEKLTHMTNVGKNRKWLSKPTNLIKNNK